MVIAVSSAGGAAPALASAAACACSATPPGTTPRRARLRGAYRRRVGPAHGLVPDRPRRRLQRLADLDLAVVRVVDLHDGAAAVRGLPRGVRRGDEPPLGVAVAAIRLYYLMTLAFSSSWSSGLNLRHGSRRSARRAMPQDFIPWWWQPA